MTDTYQATPVSPGNIAAARSAVSGDPLAPQSAGDPLSGLIAQEQQLMAEQTRTMKEREAEMAPLQAQAAQAGRDVSQAASQVPNLKTVPPAPQRNQPGADEAWLMAAMVLGAIGGGLTRQHVTNGLAAMTGALEGYNQGNTQRFEQELKKWSEEGKAARAANAEANERYTQILQSKKLALDQKLMEIQLTAAKYDDRAAMQLAQTRNLEALGRLINQRQAQQERMQQAADRIAMQREQMAQRERLQKETNQARIDAAKARSQGAGMSPEAIDMRVDLALQGNPLATKGMRAGSPDFANFSNRLAEVASERGIPAEKITQLQTHYAGETSYQRSAGTMAARVESASNEVAQLAPQALEASANLPRGKFVPYTKLKQAYQAGTSDPAYNDFLMANFALEKAYGRAMNPQGVPRVTEQMEAKAEGILSTANSPQAYATQVRRIMMEVEASKRAVAATREGVKPAPAGGSAPSAAPAMSGEMPVTGGMNKTPGGVEWRLVE